MPYHRSEEHTSELQSHSHLVCRLLLEKKKKIRHLSAGGTRWDIVAAPTKDRLRGIWGAGPSDVWFFFFNDTAPPEIYTLSLPAALPISPRATRRADPRPRRRRPRRPAARVPARRSEAHTSELQSPSHLVCPLLLSK